MPRYDLTRQDAADLVRYLRQLGATAAPGVTDEEIVLATIVADAAPEGQRRAVSQVLQRFVQIKNAGSRHEGRRATIARRHAFGERHDRAYRRWRLLRWELHGAPETWPKQLEALYAADPPFLVVSGTAGEHWAVVHEFCEQRRMPCVLPLTDEPASGPAPFYSLYFHEGVRLEARVTARHIRRKRTHDTARVLIVRPDTPKARAAADTLRLALAADGADGSALVQERVLPPSAQTNAAYWRNVLHANPADALVTWIDRGQLTGLPEALADFPAAPAVYTAAAFLGPQSAPPLHGVPRTWHVQPFRYAPAERVAYTREAEWLRAQGLSGLDPLPASQALFACHIVGEQLSAIVGNFSREYFLEGLEHMLDGTDMTSLLPATTLGQGQRFISRGAYVLATATSQGVAAEPEWIEQ